MFKPISKRSAVIAPFLLAASLCQANLVNNGGFETGDFTGWSQVGNTAFTDVSAGTFDFYGPRSGNYHAHFGAIGTLGGILEQVMSTVPGQNYKFDFWVGYGGGAPSELNISWNGSVVLGLIDPAGFGWNHYSFTMAATGSSTPIQFLFHSLPSYFHLDDISVEAIPVPEPSTYLAGGLMALVCGFHGIRSWRSRRAIS